MVSAQSFRKSLSGPQLDPDDLLGIYWHCPGTEITLLNSAFISLMPVQMVANNVLIFEDVFSSLMVEY